jgi:serine/threonine protein kinase
MSLADLIEPCLHLSDDDLAARLEQSTLLEEHRLQSARQFAVHRRTRLAAELLQTGCLTPYQLSKLVGGQTDSLRLGSAVVLDELHTGSVATTYKIRMPGVGQPVAARMLRPALSRDPAQRRQSEIVVDAMKGFSHPNIVPVLGSMVAGERFGVLTAYVESASVAALANYGIPPAVIIHLCYQAAQAISAAERAGFTHLSLRPSRLLVGRSGELHLVGFGEPDWLRKVHACEKGKRSTQWSAPELGNPGIVPDSRADVFSIGQIACQLIQSQAGADSMDDPVLCDLYEADTLDLVRSMASPSPNGRPRPDDIASCLQGIVDPSAAADWPDLALIFEHMDELTPERRAA